jgi:hypothetical protein
MLSELIRRGWKEGKVAKKLRPERRGGGRGDVCGINEWYRGRYRETRVREVERRK